MENPVASDSSKRSENTDSTTGNVKVQGDAISAEAKKVNVTDLKAALAELESKIASITEEAKKAQLNSVIAEAQKVLADKNATQEQIDSQVTLVKDAVKSVQEVAEKVDEPKLSEENRSATAESSNRETVTPARSSRGRRGRTTEVQPSDSESATPKVEAATSNKETAPAALPTYTNGTDNYALAEEMRKIVKYLKENGADAVKVAAIKDSVDKLNEKLGLTDENAVLSEEDYNKALADLKQARDFTEGFLRKNEKNEQPTVPGTERSVEPNVLNRTERAVGQSRYTRRDSSRDSKAHYNVAKEYYYEDGTKGSSPYDKYTYLFHTFTESLVANNANHSPVRDIKRLVYAEVNEIRGGYSWNITFNAAHEEQQDGYAFFSIPNGQKIDNSSINIVKTDQNGNEAEVAGSGDLLSRLQNIHPNSAITGKEIGIRRNGGREEDSLEGLARSSAYAGYYTRRLETANHENDKSDDMFNRIAANTQSVYRFQLHGRDSYTISFKTTNTNNTTMDKLYYAAGYRVQQWGRRILAEQWHGRHQYDQDDTDRFPLHVVGNGTFLIKQGKHYNTAYPQGAYGFGGRDFDYQPFRADGILGYDATGAYNSNFDMHQYTAPVGSEQPSSNTKATTAGQQFEFYDKEGNKLSASQIGMHGADKPGLVEYKVKRTFADKSSDFLNIRFAIQPKTPTFTENLANSRGQTKNLTVSNGTNGYPITLFREYMENGVKKIEKVATVNANGGGNAVFNNVLIKSGTYYAQSIIPTAAYYDNRDQKHTDVRSEKSAMVTVERDGMAPTIQVGETGKALAKTPANNQVTLFVTPNNKGEVSLDVQIQDDEFGDGMNTFSSAASGNAKYSIAGAYNSGATTFTAKGGVIGGKTVNALLKVKLNGTTIPNSGLTVTLNAKDKAGNWTDNASPSKTLTVKLLSAVPNEPPVRMLTGNDVQNGAIKQDVKNQVLKSVKDANPDLVSAGVKFEYDTIAGNTDKIKVIYPDGQTRLLTPTKGTKPTAPLVVGPQDGTVSITPQGDTDKVTFSYVPTGQTNSQQIIAKKDGNSWAIQGTRPDGITVDSRTGKITITEQAVKDQSPVTATATFLNSDPSDTARDTAKNPDNEAPTVSIKTGDGTVRKLSANAAENRFLVYRGATFNPTFIVKDNSGTTDNFMIRNIPNGVWFNKQGNKDVARTGIANGSEITFSDQVVDPKTPLGTREAIVSVRDKNGNAAEYKFQYIIADVLLKNSPKSVATGSKLGDSHQFVASTLNGTTSNNDEYFPGNMKFLWANNETENTKLPSSAQTVTKEAIVEFPDTALNGRTTANGITIYAPKQIKKNVTFNLADNEKQQATLNGISIGQTAGDPIFTVFRGANFNPQLEAWDNSGKITNITITGLPTNVTATAFPGGVQTGSESRKYTARLSNGVVPASQALGEYEATLTVQGDGAKDTSVLKFKYRVVDMDFKNGYETPDRDQPTGKSYVIGLKNGQSVNLANGDNNINPKDYWKVIDDANKTDRGYAYLPEGVNYSISGGAISSNPADKSKRAAVAMGHYGRSVSVNFTRAGDIANDTSTSRTVFTPRTIDRRLLVAVDPSAPTIDAGEDLLYGKAGERPDIKVKEIINIGESDADVGTVNKFAIRTVQLYSDRDPDNPIAEHAFAQFSRETEYTFRASDYATSRPNGLLADETIYARVKVTHRGVSTLSGNSNEKEVTAKLDVRENATNRIIQANDRILNDAEKTAIRIALRNANPTLNLSDENIEISDSGEIVITKDKKRAWLQTNPNKKDGNTTTGFITRFADIRNDYKFENIEGLKIAGRDTDKGFAWSDGTTGGKTNGNRSLVYYYDATKGTSFNLNDALALLNLRESDENVNHTENPSYVAIKGSDKVKAETNQDGFSMGDGNAFRKNGNYVNAIDLVDRSDLGGGKNKIITNSNTKLVQEGKDGGTATNLQTATIAAANGLSGFTLNNVVNGSNANSIYKAQVYLRPKWVNNNSLAERNNETKDNTTNVVNVYFVPIDPVKPVVERSDTNELGTSADNAPRLTDTSITASSLVKVTDNYDRDDLGTGATTATTGNTATPATGTANPTTGTTLENEVRKRLNVWVKKDGVETQVVRNGKELTNSNGETVLGSLIKTVDPATYELVGQASDTSGNTSEKESLGFFKVGYNLEVRPLINFIQDEKLTDDDKRTLVRVNEGGQLEELPNGATVNVTFDTASVNSDYERKRAIATITLANGATTTKVIPYTVYLGFPGVNKLYDFAGATKYNWYHDPDYYKNVGLTGGMNWFVKREIEENGEKVLKDLPPITQGDKDDSVMARELNKDIKPETGGVGEYKYIYGATYPTGRFVARATDELSKLRREVELVHTVFDVGANDTNKITVNSGDSLTSDQAKAAVMTINGSKDLPDGTTYEWVNNTVTGRGGTEVEREVRVTLPATDPNGPYAAQQRKSKTVKVKVKVKPTKPTVTPDDNGDVRIGYTNEPNVNRMEVTYTPADTNRLKDNGDVTRTPQERTTVIATKGTDNQWRITSGAKEGIDVNPTTGEITLKDQVVKDQTQIQAKVVAQEVPSAENDSNNSKDGDRISPTIDVNNTLVEAGREFSIPLGLSDGTGVGVDETNIKVSSPNGVTGLTYDPKTKSIKGTISTVAKKEITVRVLDKNGNKAEQTISIAAVKAKPIYAIKDGTIANVDTASNFVEMPAGLTASWKDNSKPTTTEVGNTNKTVTVSAEGYNAKNVDIPVKVYDRVTLKKPMHVNALGKLVNGENVNNYVNGVGQGVTVKWKDDVVPDVSKANLNLKGYIEVSYATDDPTQPMKDILEVNLPTYSATLTHTSYETTVGTPFGNSDARRGDYFTHDYPVKGESSPVKAFWSSRDYFHAGRDNAATTIGRVEDTIGVFFPNEAGQPDYEDKRRQLLPIIFDVKPKAPTLNANQFQGKAGTKPEITVNNLPTTAQLTTGSTVKVQLKDAAGAVVAEKIVTDGTGSTKFTEADYRNPVTLGQQLTANVVVSGTYQKTEKTDAGTRQVPTEYSLASNNSNSEQVTPQKPTFDTATVTSTSRKLSGTLGGFDAPNKVVKVHLNDENGTVLSSEHNGEVTINNNGTWTATLPKNVKLRQSVAKNGETTTPPAITVENTVTGGTVSTTSDNKAVEMGAYSVTPTIAGSKHIDITVPHDAKRVELRFHNREEKGDKANSITLVRGTDGAWHTDATRADNTTVTDANGYVGTISSAASKTNPAESVITIPLNEESNRKKLYIREEAANGDDTATYGKGLGLRVEYQPEAGQDPVPAGNWKVVSVTNTAPTIQVKGDTGKDVTHRKVYDSGTTLTANVLKELVTVTDPEDGRTAESEKPYGKGNVKVVSVLPTATGATPAGLYEVTLAAVDSQGKEGSQVTVYVAIKEATPTAPAVDQWQNGNVKVTPATTNSGDKITIPLTSGSVVVTKDAQNRWQVTGQPNGVRVHDGSIEIPRNLVNDTVSATASKGEGDIKAVSDEGTHTLTAHEVTKVDIIKKPTETLEKTDLSGKTGVTGVVENGVIKTYQKAGIKSVTSVGTSPTLTPDRETGVPVLITYNDGSQEKTNVTLKVAPAAPNVTVQPQDGTTGDVTLTIKRHDDTSYPDDSVVTVHGIDGTFNVKNGTITIKNNQLKDTVQTGKVTVKEAGKLLVETDEDKVIPAKKVESATPTVTFGTPAKDSGDIEVTVMNGTAPYAKGSKITLPGIDKEYEVGDNGKITVPNSELPDSETAGAPKATETGKLPKAGSSVTTPAKLKDSAVPKLVVEAQDPNTGSVTVKVTDQNGQPLASGTTVQIPGVSGDKAVVDGKVELSNNDLPETATRGKGRITEPGKLPTEGTVEVEVPAKLTSAKGEPATEFEVIIPLPIVVSNPEDLTPDEKTELEKKVKESNPNMDVKVDDKGNVTITDPTTGQSKVIPVKDLTVKDFEPVKPTEKVPVKDKAHLTPEEKKQVADKVKEKNPGKEVTVGDDGTATVTDPTTGISHTIPGTDLVNHDFTPVKPTEKVPVKDKTHLTPEEKKQVADKVKEKNPGKEVTVGDDGTATVTDPTTGISHTIPGTDLVNHDFEPVKPTEKVPVKDKAHLTPEEKKQVADKVKEKNPGKEVTVGDDGTATVTDPTTGISHTIPGTDLVNHDFEPVKPRDKVPVKDPDNLTQEEQDKVKESVEKANPGKKVTVDKTGKVTITDPNTNISHEIPGEKLITLDPPVFELPEYTGPISTTGVDENGNLLAPPTVNLPALIITKWTDEAGKELKPADAKAPSVPGEANEAFEHGEIEGYVFVRTETEGDVVTHIFRKVSPGAPTGDGQQGQATPSADTNRRPDTASPAEVPATQPAEQPSQTVEVPAQLPNEVSETNPSVSQLQAVLPNTGTQEDRATGAFGVLSLLGAFGLLFAKKKKDDEEEA